MRSPYTIDPALRSWIPVTRENDFPIQNIPFGIGTTPVEETHVITRIGDAVIDITMLERLGFLGEVEGLLPGVLEQPFLNDLMACGKATGGRIRQRIAELFATNNPDLRDHDEARSFIILDPSSVEMRMPVKVGDYTDFYSSIEHATNVGKMFRDPENALLPNWRHLPVGYHGRASSVVVSGTPVCRPKGQVKDDLMELPDFIPTRQLDFELEMAFVTCRSTLLGDRVSTADAEDYIFGLMLFNDLSARDIQKWEYVPLGPFLSKSFGSVVSPWVVTLEALKPFRTEGPVQHPPVLPYLQFSGNKNFDISLEVFIKPNKGKNNLVCSTNYKFMYWNMCQQLAHQTVNGCNINVGDLYASGTISGPWPDSFGSLLELTWKGTKPLEMNDGSTRTFLLDHDEVIIHGYCRNENLRIGFGECTTRILPAR